MFVRRRAFVYTEEKNAACDKGGTDDGLSFQKRATGGAFGARENNHARDHRRRGKPRHSAVGAGHLRGDGLRSSSTVHKYLNRLAEAGYIFRDTTASRGISILRDENGADYSYLRNEEEEDAFEEMLNLPVVGNVAAGEPIFADENIEDKIAYPARFVRRDGRLYAAHPRREHDRRGHQ